MTQMLFFSLNKNQLSGIFIWVLFLFFSFLNFISLALNYIAPFYGCYLKFLNLLHWRLVDVSANGLEIWVPCC